MSGMRWCCRGGCFSPTAVRPRIAGKSLVSIGCWYVCGLNLTGGRRLCLTSCQIVLIDMPRQTDSDSQVKDTHDGGQGIQAVYVSVNAMVSGGIVRGRGRI